MTDQTCLRVSESGVFHFEKLPTAGDFLRERGLIRVRTRRIDRRCDFWHKPSKWRFFQQQAAAPKVETADPRPIRAGLLGSAIFMRFGQGDIKKRLLRGSRIGLVSKVVVTTNGRGDWIRTSDLYVPNVALQPD